MKKYLLELYTNDMVTLERLYLYSIHLENGETIIASELKNVLNSMGLDILNTYKAKLLQSPSKKKLNWEYISALSTFFYSQQQVQIWIVIHL